MSHTPTSEQVAITNFARNTKSNLIISALAGAAKTSTLVMVAEALTKEPILCLAFNKRIADEMKERLPPNCTAQTLNSLGHRVWMDTISGRVALNTKKTFENLSSIIEKLPKARKDLAYEDFADTMKLIDFGKACGYIPTGHFKAGKRLMNDDEFFQHLEDAPSAIQEQLIRDASVLSIEQALAGMIDFGDQIMMPTLFPAMFPSFPVVMIDEAQDLSALNHATLRKLAKRRLIAVGDPNQAIYGFRGAHEDSMALLQQSFNMESLQLSVSFRCPRAVVREAQWRAPQMTYPEWAVEGEVTTLREWDQSVIPQTAAIICRNNAPLFSMAIKLLKNGRYPQIIGNDIGKYLLKVMKKFGSPGISQSEVLTAIRQWGDEKLAKTRNAGKVHDQMACLEIFAGQGQTLGDAMAYAEHLFRSQGPIQLMTAHKAKGLEFDTVFILDRQLIQVEAAGESGQERNILYVAQTRAKQRLIYVESEGFFDAVGE